MTRQKRSQSGQMTIELALAIPALIVVAVIATNAMTFFSDCAVFDRVAHEAIRVHATAPAYGQGYDQSCALVEQTVRAQINKPNVDIRVSHGTTGFDLDEYTVTIEYAPTLFGLGLRSEVFGVPLPRLVHTTRYVVDGYRPGVVI